MYTNIREALLSTKEKEGKENTIVKIIKAKKACISSDQTTEDNKKGIKLSSIMNDLNPENEENRWWGTIEEQKRIECRITPYDTVTDEDIKCVVDSLKNFGLDVEWEITKTEIIILVISKFNI